MKNKDVVKKLKKVKDIMFDDPDEALRLIESIKVKEIDLEDYYEMSMITGDVLYYNHQYDRAIELYKKALDIPIENKDEALCYCQIADCYNEQYKSGLAIDNYRKALSYDDKIDKKTLGDVYHGLATIYVDLTKFEEARDYYEKIAELYKHPVDEVEKQQLENALSSLSTCYWKMGNDDKSEEYYNKTIALPDITYWILARTYATKAHRLYEKAIWQEALENYKKAISLTNSEESKKDWQKYADICEKELKKLR